MFEALPVVWFDKLVKILSLVESEGVLSGAFSR